MDRIIEKKTWTAKRIIYVALAVVLIPSTAYLLVFGDQSSKVNVSGERLTISTVTVGQFQEFIPINGTIVPIRTLYLDAVEGGRVEKRFLEAGSFVEKGDPILQLSNTTLMLDIMVREANFYEQSNNLRNTKLAMEQNRLALQSELLEINYQLISVSRDRERNIKLKEKALISAKEYYETADRYDYLVARLALTKLGHIQDSLFRATQIGQIERSLTRMQENLDLVKLNQDALLLRAPVTGHLTSLTAEIGESKVRGERLGQIDILDGFKALISIDEHYINRVQVGQIAKVTFGSNSYSMQVNKIFPEVLAGQFQIELGFGSPAPEGIRRGQAVRARLALGDLSDAILMDRGGFFNKTGGRWIYVLNDDSTEASKRTIRLGRQNQDQYEILSGLEPGERVIVSSYNAFGDFDKVILK